MKVDGHETHFKLDTGAAVSIVSDQEPWLKANQLKKPQQILRGPGSTILSVVGTFQATLTYEERQISETVYVLKDQLYSLFSKKACVGLGLIARIGEVNTQPANFVGEFPHLFSGLGKLETKYQIKLNLDVQPVCLYTPRKISHPLLPKVKKERCHFSCHCSHRVVLWHRPGPKTQWACTDLCRHDTTEQSSAARNSSHGFC